MVLKKSAAEPNCGVPGGPSSPKRLGAVVVDSASGSGVTFDASEAAPALTSEGVASSKSSALAVGLLSGSANETTGSCGLKVGKSSSDGDFTTVRGVLSSAADLSFAIASATRSAISALEKPRRVTSSSRESARNRLSKAFHPATLSAAMFSASAPRSVAIAGRS